MVKRHGHVAPFLKSCPKCVRLRTARQARARKALLKQRTKARAAIRRKGKPRFKGGKDPNFLKWIRTLPCAIVARDPKLNQYCQVPIQAAHIVSRGAGGMDRGNVIPLCQAAHREQHLHGIEWFANEYFYEPGPDGPMNELKHVALSYADQYEKAVAAGWAPGDAP